MNYQNYIQEHKDSLKDRVVVFLMKDEKILFGEKLDGIGEGKLVGIGGKVEEGESLEEAVIRESQEEISVTPKNFERFVTINYFFPNKEKWSQRVNFFICEDWKGKPKESEEMSPSWFGENKIPFDRSWDDYRFWFTEGIVNERKMNGNIFFGEDNEMVVYSEIVIL